MRCKKTSAYLIACAVGFSLALLCGINGVRANERSKSRIREIDFRNFTYPGFWSKGRIKIRNGKLETETKYCMTEYSVEGVNYLDFTGDGEEEALVHVTDFTACGSSGISNYYYVFTMRHNRSRLLWRFATGSEGICGLKDFRVENKEMIFELFGNCRIRGSNFSLLGGVLGECCPEQYTRIRVAWNGRGFIQKSAEKLPFPYKSINEYEASKRR